MTMKLAVLFLIASLATGTASADSKGPVNGGQDMTGSWRATVTIASPTVCGGAPTCTYRALATWSSDGTVIQTAAIPGSSAGYGVWKRVGSRRFVAHAEYLLSQNGVQVATASSRIDVDLDASGRVGSGAFTVTVYSLDGQFIEEYAGSATFERIAFD